MESENFHGLKLLAHCGGGAFGDVYYCEDPSGKRMALKIVSKKKIGDHWERELKGVKNYRKITEENNPLLKIFHVAEDENCFYYTMEAADSADPEKYIPDTLALRLQKGPLPQEQLADVIQGIFEGIKAIHNPGFTHRDIKPDNILFVNGVPKLGDIGLLSSLSVTVTQFAGTLDFMPPEERSAESSDSTDRNSRRRNDLYAFGKVIYCAVTGNSPEMFPHIPKDFNLSIQRKYYLHLAFQLCDREPLCRLNSIEKTELALAGIRRKLEYGITGKDLFCDTAKKLKYWALRALAASWKMTRLYWYLIIPLLLLTGTGAYFLFRPKPPMDIAKITTKEYVNKDFNLSMRIPIKWIIFDEKHIQSLSKEDLKKNGYTKQQNEAILKELKFAKGLIACDLNPKFTDVITIEHLPITQQTVEENSTGDFELALQQLWTQQYGFDCKIFNVQKIKIAQQTSLLIDYSLKSNLRSLRYIIAFNDRSIALTLTAKAKTFQRRRQEFGQVISTIKFWKQKRTE